MVKIKKKQKELKEKWLKRNGQRTRNFDIRRMASENTATIADLMADHNHPLRIH